VAATQKSRAQARAVVVPFPGGRGRRARTAAFIPTAASVAAGIALFALALGGYVAARASSAFAIEELRVEGAPPALAREIRSVLSPLAGESLLALDRRELVARLEAIPHVRRAGYDRAFPHTLVVTVERELPVAVLRRGPESFLVSDRGRVLQRVARGAHPRLPRVWIPTRVDAPPGAVLADADAVRGVRAVARLPRDGSRLRVRAVEARPHELSFVLASGIELRLGNEQELDLKLAVAERVVPTLTPPAAGGPQYLDLSVPERAVAGRNPQVEGRA
jgi:cell division protein FtsQ